MNDCSFNPLHHPLRTVDYLSRALKESVRLLHAEPLEKSTREAPWLLHTEVAGTARKYVLRLASRGLEHEYHVLLAMQAVSVPTPRVYGWDPEGDALGVASFFMDYVHGESLLQPVLAGEPWAEALFIDSVCQLQAVTRDQLAEVAHRLEGEETACDVLETAYAFLRTQTAQPLVDAAYSRLIKTPLPLPGTRFSNGDLWLDNVVHRDQQLAGFIDFANAGFSDPIYEFMLPSFLEPRLRERGLDKSYCAHMGFDPTLLHWYHGLECFDAWHWTLRTGQPYGHHTAEDLHNNLGQWVDAQ